MQTTQKQQAHTTKSLKSISLPIEGMECAACAVRIEKQLMKRDGVATASVNLANQKASIQYNPNQINIDGLVKSVEKGRGFSVPYTSTPTESQELQSHGSYTELFRKFLFAAVLTLPVFVISMAHGGT